LRIKLPIRAMVEQLGSSASAKASQMLGNIVFLLDVI
jgi:hypothetical protein